MAGGEDDPEGDHCTVSGDVRDWDMELDESELASLENDISPTPSGSEVNPVGYDQGDGDSSYCRGKGPRKVATTASESEFLLCCFVYLISFYWCLKPACQILFLPTL